MKLNFKALKPWAKKHESTLWAAGGVGLLWFGAGLGARAAIRINRKLEKTRDDNKLSSIRDIPAKETAKIVVKEAAIPVVVAASGTACVLKGNNVSLKKSAALTAMLATAESRAETIAEATIEKVGEKKTKEIHAEACQKQINKDIESGELNEMAVQKTGDGSYLFRFVDFDRYVRTTQQGIVDGFAEFNEDLANDGWLPVNHLFDIFGMDPLDYGDEVGYCDKNTCKGRVTWTKYVAEGIDGEPTWCIEITSGWPRADYQQ